MTNRRYFFVYCTDKKSVCRSILFCVANFHAKNSPTSLARKGLLVWLCIYKSINIHALQDARPIFLIIGNMCRTTLAGNIQNTRSASSRSSLGILLEFVCHSSTITKTDVTRPNLQFCSNMVRVERVELSSPVWKTGIITVIRHPHVPEYYNRMTSMVE